MVEVNTLLAKSLVGRMLVSSDNDNTVSKWTSNRLRGKQVSKSASCALVVYLIRLDVRRPDSLFGIPDLSNRELPRHRG